METQTDPNWAVPYRTEPYRTMQWKSATSEPKLVAAFLGSIVTEMEPEKWVISAAHNTNTVKQAENLSHNRFQDNFMINKVIL